MRAYEELDHAVTPWGDLTLVRRRVPQSSEGPAYEVKLGGALLMSSRVTESERALARLALAPRAGRPARVLVGGLGLGYTAVEALEQPGTTLLHVVDLLPQVIGWHVRGLVPLGARLTSDPRVRLIEADVFALLLADPPSTVPGGPPVLYDALLLDVDHSPDALLRPEHGGFYAAAGLARAARHLAPGGVLGIWSALAPEEAFRRRLAGVFPRVEAHPVSFWNPNNDAEETNSVYLAWV